MTVMNHVAKVSRTLMQRRRVRLVLAAAAIDIVIMWVAFTAAFSAHALTVGGLEYYPARIAFIMLAAVILVVMFYLTGMYHRIWARTSAHDIFSIINAVTFVTLFLVLANEVIEPHPLPVSVILMGTVLALNGFVVVRYRSRVITGLQWRWRAVWKSQFPESKSYVLIIGAGEAAQALAWRIRNRVSTDGYQVVGFVDDDPRKQGMYVEGYPVIGSCDEIPTLTETHGVSLLIVAINNISGPQFRTILNYCEQTNALIKVVPDVFKLMSSNTNTPLLRDVQPEDYLGRSPIGRHSGIDLGPVTNKVLMVTGAAGSIGSELSRQLVSYNPVSLILLDNNESGLHDLVTELNSLAPDSRLIPVLADITNEELVAQVFDDHRPQVVFHAAAYKHVPMLELYPNQAIRVNVGGTRIVGELALDYGVERFVLISTDKAVRPSSIMGATKRMCELLMHALSEQSTGRTLFTAVRFGNVLGSRGSVVPTFTRQIESGGPVTVTHRDMTRYFLTIPEAVNLVIHAACLTKGNDLFMLKMGEVVKIVELAERMIRMRGLRPYLDIDIQFTGIRPGEKLHEQLASGSEFVNETAHPNIVELVETETGFRSQSYMSRVESLLNNGLSSDADTLDQLLAIAQPSRMEDVTNAN